MVQVEKDKLLALLDHRRKWCQGIDAADGRGQAVHYDDADAVSWDLVGALCHLFGEKRASRLCETIARHVVDQVARRRSDYSDMRASDIVAMSALLDFNDAEETTYEVLIERLRELPVWQGRRSMESGPAVE